jgi:hypothetical protein
MSGVVAHFLAGEIAVKDDLFFVAKLALIDLHKLDLRAHKVNPKLLAGIINDTHPHIAASAKDIARLKKWGDLFERATFALLILGFAWAILGPFLLR